ncbi:arsenic resistance N-acetyltransferase ArsN2 [Calidithermus roseus]|uniref:Amino-acid acetyltransferase n=1 Tax=Calidithermus roseus TaxID=1644118 RepID=A0A399EUE1_9DEIN|nr:arsenic resistance N-acetyltransferase ArsN2 [Calidithermus roseus]RIH87150.1 Amino-acid acetyltransferase [Calidithermus roseus]
MRQARTEGLPQVLELLRQVGLPLEGVAQHLESFLLEFDDEKLVGCAGLEVWDQAGLLRSVAVHPDYRSRGIAGGLVRAALEQARRRGLKSLSLLTTTAEDYFPRFGFVRVERSQLPTALHASEEFRGACPATAAALHLTLS